MADYTNHRSSQDHSESVVLERVQELSWALLDEQITEDELGLLDNLLLCDDKARNTYIGCVQLHTDLMAHFAAKPGQSEAAAAPAKSPVLGFLNAGMPPVGLQSPPVEDVRP